VLGLRRRGLLSCSVLQQLRVHRVLRDLYIPDDRATNEAVLYGGLRQVATGVCARGTAGGKRALDASRGWTAPAAAPYHVRVLGLVEDGNVEQLDVQVLVDRMERALNAKLVLQLHNDGLPDQRLEERVEQLCPGAAHRAGGRLDSLRQRALSKAAAPPRGRVPWLRHGSLQPLRRLAASSRQPAAFV